MAYSQFFGCGERKMSKNTGGRNGAGSAAQAKVWRSGPEAKVWRKQRTEQGQVHLWSAVKNEVDGQGQPQF